MSDTQRFEMTLPKMLRLSETKTLVEFKSLGDYDDKAIHEMVLRYIGWRMQQFKARQKQNEKMKFLRQALNDPEIRAKLEGTRVNMSDEEEI